MLVQERSGLSVMPQEVLESASRRSLQSKTFARAACSCSWPLAMDCPLGGVCVTSQIFPSRGVFISQGRAFRERASVSPQPPAPAAAGGRRTGPVEGLWVGHQSPLLYLVSYLRGK